MSGPWENYAAAPAQEAGPWNNFRPSETPAQNPAEYDPKSPEFQARYGPAGVSAGENLLASSGKMFTDIGRGVGERLGLVSKEDVAASRRSDAPLMATTAGKIGNIGTGILTTLPALAIPGANTVTGAATGGAILGALQPYESTQESVVNTALGAASGAAGQVVGKKIGQFAVNRLTARSAESAALKSANSVRDATLATSQEAGYVVPPTATNPSLTNTVLESASGRHATKQAAMVKNQTITNELVRGDLGLPKSAPINQVALQSIRSKAGQVYAQVKRTGTIPTDSPYLDDLSKITNADAAIEKEFPGAQATAAEKVNALVASLKQEKFSASAAVEYSKRLRFQASGNFKLAGRSGDPEALALAHAQIKGADALEDMVGRHLQANGQPELMASFEKARTQIAQTYSVDAALNDATGNVDTRILARQLDAGRPLSGGLKKAAQFGQAFAEVAGEPVKGAGVSKLAFASAAGGALLGHPELLALPAASYAARKTLLAAPINRMLARPDYAPNALGTLALKSMKKSSRLGLPAGLAAAQAQQ